jgi:hypothetical protein
MHRSWKDKLVGGRPESGKGHVDDNNLLRKGRRNEFPNSTKLMASANIEITELVLLHAWL